MILEVNVASPTKNRFKMPWGDNGYWYSYDSGNIHFIVLSFEHDYQPNSEQYLWLVDDLQKIDRNKTPWTIVAAHRPLYSSGNSASDYLVASYLRVYLEQLFLSYQVDLVLTGHYHNYERTCSIFNGTCVANGKAPVHIVVGTAGIEIGDDWMEPSPSWSVFRAATYGHLLLETSATKMQMKFVGCSDGAIHDQFELIK